MGVFEEVFAKRSSPEAEDAKSMGAFEEVFVRRGQSPTLSDMNDLNVSKIDDLTLAESDQSSQADTAASPSDIPWPSVLEITDASQFVVKNTFIDGEAVDFDSLREFLIERKMQTCPAGLSVNIDDIDPVDIGAERTPKHEMFNTASHYGDIDAPLYFNTGSHYGDVDAPLMDTHQETNGSICGPSGFAETRCQDVVSDSAFPSVGCQAFYMDKAASLLYGQHVVAENLLTNLRRDGSAIHRTVLRMKVSEMNQMTVENVCGAHDAQLPLPPPPPETAPAIVPVLRLAEQLPPPEIGTPALPSIGSLLHHKKECKPCTFFHTRGCENGDDCQFCHLCGPSEKKKRLRAERHFKREAKETALENARAVLASYSAMEECAETGMVVE